MQRLNLNPKIISIAILVLLIISVAVWGLAKPAKITDYCVIANGGQPLDSNQKCAIKDTNKDNVTVIISIEQGIPYVGTFTIDRDTYQIIDKNEAF